MSFKTSVLEGSRLDFGGPRPRFWRVLGTMFRFCHLFLASFPRNGCSQTQCQDCQESRKRRERRNGQKPAKTRTRSQIRPRWVGGGAPPPGGFQSAAPPLVVRSVLDLHVKCLPVMLPQVLAKRFFQKFLAQEASDPSLFPSPAAAHSASSSQNHQYAALLGSKMASRTLPKRCSKFASKKH